jgi:5'(3')-deoxyribonucleotidase
MWQVDIHEEKRRAQDIYDSGVVRKFRLMDKAKPVLSRLSKDYRLVVLTSRVKSIEKDTRDWIDEHFENIFDDIHFAGFYDELTHSSHLYTKDEISQQIGADYLVDDQLKHCIAAAGVGITSLLFGEYSWNKAKNLPEGVKRVKNWEEIEEYFAKRG